MRKGERVIVITNDGVRHPKGTLVEIKIIGSGTADKKPFYCQAVGGQTCYWYAEDEITKEIDGYKA